MSASALLALKQSDPDAYRAALARVEAARMAAPPPNRPGVPPPVSGRSLDTVVDYFNRAYSGMSDDAARSARLRDIRRGVVYACVTLRADMLAGLPIHLYRASKSAGGRTGTLAKPLARLGKPARVRDVPIGEVQAERIVDAPVTKMLARPNADWSGDGLIRWTEAGLCLMGEAHWRLAGVTPQGGKPTAIDPYKQGRLKPIKRGDASVPADAEGRTVVGWELDGNKPGSGGLSAREVVWLRYPDPEDPDYGTLAPAQIAALGAEAYASALGSNRDIFKQGLRAAGAFVPGEEMAAFGWDQADELTRDVNDMLIGSKNNHRVPVFPFRYDFRAFNVTPRDAEFIALMEFAIEDVARAFRIPIEMVGGTRRTYQSTETADRALWQRCLAPEAAWIANELTIKLLPAFGYDDSYFIGFDLSDVVALQEDEASAWERESGQIAAGVLGVDEWRTENGREPFGDVDRPMLAGQMASALSAVQMVGTGQIAPAQGEAYLVAIGIAPDAAKAMVGDGAMPPPEAEDTTEDDAEDATEAPSMEPGEPMPMSSAPRPTLARAIEWDSALHRAVLDRAAKATAKIEDAFEATTAELFRRQMKSIVDQLGGDGRAARDLTIAGLASLFNRARWIKEFRTAALPHYKDALKAAGRTVYTDLEVDGEFDTGSPTAVNYMRRKAQRFAAEVNDTTWQRLRGSLAQGIADGETVPELTDRVKAVMTSQADNWARVVAITETHAAYMGGSQLSAAQAGEDAGLELEKEWVSALDARVRDDHADAHGQTVPIDEEFEVGGARGMTPGELGDPAQDVNCRCVAVYSIAKSKRTTDQASEVLYELLAALPR